MGGRIASLIADEAGVAGLICLGYPFHPVGDPTASQRVAFEDFPTVFTCLFGDEAAKRVGYPPLGLSYRAGCALALADARELRLSDPYLILISELA